VNYVNSDVTQPKQYVVWFDLQEFSSNFSRNLAFSNLAKIQHRTNFGQLFKISQKLTILEYF